ncbi:Zn-ribbon domain-containing OB-fold protein [Nocardia takedensis]
MRTAAHPRWYDPTPEDPVLDGCECAKCGWVYFPPITLGCESCGARAEHLETLPLPAVGAVFAVAEVDPSGAAPHTVAEIVLDSGVLIRAMAHPDGPPLRIGDRVRARWSVLDRDETGAELVEPAFERVEDEGRA